MRQAPVRDDAQDVHGAHEVDDVHDLGDGSARPEQDAPSRRAHVGGRALVGLALVVVVLGGLGVWRWNQRGPERASIDDATQRFRSSSTAAHAESPNAPAEGVYVVSGTGSERLSFLDTAQQQGPSMPATITSATPGCWTLKIEYNSFHAQQRTFCAVDELLLERGGTTDQRFDFAAFTQSEHSDVVCDPPAVLYDADTATQGHTWPLSCRGTSQTTDSTMRSEGETMFVGRETLTVGGAAITTLHYRQEITFRGDQTGSQIEDFWLAADNWLPVRNERSIRVVSPAPEPIGSVTYTEEGSWQLTALTPRT